MIFYILLVGFVIFMIIGYFGNKQKEHRKLADPIKFAEEEATNQYFKATQKFSNASYFMGHPDINEPLKVHLYNDGKGNLGIADSRSFFEKKIGLIPFDAINSITIEDQTTMDKKVTLGRVLLVGLFALAWKKNKKLEAAYIIINWKIGKFGNETYFKIDGSGSISNANTIRNQLIKWTETK